MSSNIFRLAATCQIVVSSIKYIPAKSVVDVGSVDSLGSVCLIPPTCEAKPSCASVCNRDLGSIVVDVEADSLRSRTVDGPVVSSSYSGSLALFWIVDPLGLLLGRP
jgi:hypothetical protein